MSDRFDLRTLVRRISEENHVVDPAVVWGKTATQIPDDSVRDVLDQWGPEMVRKILTAGRVELPVLDTPQSSKSKWAEVGAVYKKWLSEPFKTADAWKPLGLCDRDDIAFIRDDRVKQAQANADAAKRMGRLLGAMEAHNASLVQELPEVVVLEVLR